ncbi:hypothetical protein [Tenacibaculum mesophilum]|uniref:hypothetical protein n=1 Tax=Tenacibaculum mesophilum TaxID=104268 RepID=UPI00069F18BA|nr:hypothetical protein [Tenacibaculum mesophilum]GFD76917.1 hypothetical protein KUL113_63370 [Tenacibaculum sp. KUL113]
MENLFKERRDGESPGIFVGRIIFGIIAVLMLAILFGYAIMWLWNNLMPDIFGLSVINYWQAVGLFILAKILFSSSECGGKHKSKKYSNKRRKHKFKSHYEKNCKGKFSEWEHYDRFWKEEGSEAYQKYVDKLNKETEQE